MLEFVGLLRNLVACHDVTFLSAHPKSGITWMSFLIANYITQGDCDFKKILKIVPDIHINPYQVRHLKKPKIAKTHEMYKSIKHRRYIYLVRDPRDVIVSQFFFMKRNLKIPEQAEISDYIRQHNSITLRGRVGWADHVMAWSPTSTGKGMFIRYEDMLTNPCDALVSILNYLGVDIEGRRIQIAVESSSFNTMRKLEADDPSSLTDFREGTNVPFVREGKSGQWKEYAFLAEMDEYVCLNESGMRKYGYY